MTLPAALDPVAGAVFAFVVHALWQPVVVAAIVALVLKVARRASASTASSLWFAALVACVALPAATSILAPPVMASPAGIPGTAPRTSPAPERDALQPVGVSALNADVPRGVSRAVLCLWILGAVVGLGRLVGAGAELRRIKAGARALPAELAGRLAVTRRGRAFRLGSSADVRVPLAVGFGRPMVLVPESMTERLDAADVAVIVEHEAAHLARWDDWTNAAQRIVCALLFFSPAAWWIARRLEFEREVAADDCVLATARPAAYAAALVRVAEHVAGAGHRLAPAAFGSRGTLSDRVTRILSARRNGALRASAVTLAAAVAAVGASFVASWRFVPPIAIASDVVRSPAARPVPASIAAPTRRSTIAHRPTRALPVVGLRSAKRMRTTEPARTAVLTSLAPRAAEATARVHGRSPSALPPAVIKQPPTAAPHGTTITAPPPPVTLSPAARTISATPPQRPTLEQTAADPALQRLRTGGAARILSAVMSAEDHAAVTRALAAAESDPQFRRFAERGISAFTPEELARLRELQKLCATSPDAAGCSVHRDGP